MSEQNHRGGSFLSDEQYCSRYIVSTRGKGEINTGTNHLGFRCVKSASQSTTKMKFTISAVAPAIRLHASPSKIRCRSDRLRGFSLFASILISFTV